jgi:hypothetical protein
MLVALLLFACLSPLGIGVAWGDDPGDGGCRQGPPSASIPPDLQSNFNNDCTPPASSVDNRPDESFDLDVSTDNNLSDPSCGTAFIHFKSLSENGNGQWQEQTGFKGASNAVGYTWTEHITVTRDGDVIKDYTVNQSGGLLARSDWTGQHKDYDTDNVTLRAEIFGTYYVDGGATGCTASGTDTADWSRG